MKYSVVVVIAMMTAWALPDPKSTPGAIFPTATKDVICKRGYSKVVRNVGRAEKKRICAAYGAQECPGPKWEVDHFVSLELGGSNDASNLWPQPIGEARQKDKVEDRLAHMVCGGKIDLPTAQEYVKTWWEHTK